MANLIVGIIIPRAVSIIFWTLCLSLLNNAKVRNFQYRHCYKAVTKAPQCQAKLRSSRFSLSHLGFVHRWGFSKMHWFLEQPSSCLFLCWIAAACKLPIFVTRVRYRSLLARTPAVFAPIKSPYSIWPTRITERSSRLGRPNMTSKKIT